MVSKLAESAGLLVCVSVCGGPTIALSDSGEVQPDSRLPGKSEDAMNMAPHEIILNEKLDIFLPSVGVAYIERINPAEASPRPSPNSTISTATPLAGCSPIRTACAESARSSKLISPPQSRA